LTTSLATLEKLEFVITDLRTHQNLRTHQQPTGVFRRESDGCDPSNEGHQQQLDRPRCLAPCQQPKARPCRRCSPQRVSGRRGSPRRPSARTSSGRRSTCPQSAIVGRRHRDLRSGRCAGNALTGYQRATVALMTRPDRECPVSRGHGPGPAMHADVIHAAPRRSRSLLPTQPPIG